MSAKRTATVIEARCDCCNREDNVVQIVAVPDDTKLSPRAVRLCLVCVGFAYGAAAHGIQESTP